MAKDNKLTHEESAKDKNPDEGPSIKTRNWDGDEQK